MARLVLKKLLKPTPGSSDFASKDLLLELVPCRCSRFFVHGSVKMKYSKHNSDWGNGTDVVILLDVLSIVSSSKEQKKQEHLDRQSSSIIHFSDLLGTAQGITGRPRIVGLGFFLSLLAWVLFQGLLICIAGRRWFEGGFAHGLFEKHFCLHPQYGTR